MRICMFLNASVVGDQRVYKEARTLADSGYEVTILCNQPKDTIISEVWAGIKIISIPRRPSPLFPLRFTFQWLRTAIKLKPDVIHAHDLSTLGRALIVARLTGAKLLYDSHDYYTETSFVLRMPKWKQLYYLLKEKLLIKFAEVVIVPVPAGCEVIARKYGISNTKCIANFPIYRRLQKFNRIRESFGFDEQIKIVLYEGVLAKERGLEQLVCSANYLGPGVVIIIMGNGYLIPVLKKLIHAENVSDRVKIIAGLPFEEFSSYCVSADLGVMFHCDDALSSHLSWHTKIFDYLIAGLPVIVSDLREVARLVREYEIGEVVSDVRPKIIARAIVNLLNDQKRYEACASNARRVIKEVFNWEFEAQKLIDNYKKFDKPAQISSIKERIR